MITVLVWSLAFCLLVAQFLEHCQIYVKSNSSFKGTIAKGYNDAMKIMVVNRLFIVSYYFIFGFLIDYGVDFSEFFYPLLLSLLLLAVSNTYLSARYRRKIRSSSKSANLLPPILNKLSMTNAAATYFNLLGIVIPLLVASLLPEYRLTLSNSSFLFNTVFVLLNVFIIENRLADIYDNKGDIVGVTYSIIAVRTVASLMALLTIWLIDVFVSNYV